MTNRRMFPSRTSDLMLPFLVLLVLVLAPSGSGRAANDGDNGTIPLLVRSRVPLTPEVAAAIGFHGVRVTYTWPEINAMAVTVNPAKIAELTADPLVGLVEADSMGQLPDNSSDVADSLDATLEAAPGPYSTTTIQ